MVSRFNLEDPSRVASTVLHLVSTMLPKNAPDVKGRFHTKSNVDVAWVLEILTRLSLLFGQKSFQNASAPAVSYFHTVYLKVLRDFISETAQQRDSRSSFLKASILLSRSLGQVLLSNSGYSPPPLENALCWTMLELYNLSCSHSTILEFLCGHLRPIIQGVLAKNAEFKKLGTDLEVCDLLSRGSC